MNVFAPSDKDQASARDGDAARRGGSPGEPPRGYPHGAYPAGYAAAGRAAGPDEDEIDLRALLLTLWRRKWVIVIAAATLATLAAVYVAQLQPSYRASSKVLFDPPQLNIVDIEQVLASPETSRDGVQNQIEILRSTSLLERVADSLALDATPEFNPALRPAPTGLAAQAAALAAAPLAEGRRLLTDLGLLAPPPVAAPDPEAAARRARLALIDQLRDGLDLKPVANSRVIEVAFTSPNPQLAARIVNASAEQYIFDQLDAKLAATRTATEWLSVRVSELQERVRGSEEAVETARAELSIAAGQGSDITRQQVQAVNLSLSGARAALSALEARHGRVVEALATGRDFGAVSEFRESAIIQGYRDQEADLLAQEVSLRASVRPGHPALQRLDARLEEVRRNIRDEAGRVAAALGNDLASARAQETALVAELRALETKALEQSRGELRLRQLEREAQASRLLYENFLARLKETAEQQDLQAADARILSRAEPPNQPESALRKRAVLAAAFAGGLLGIGIVFLLERLNNTFRSPSELEAHTGLPVLATLPRVGARMRRSQVLTHLRTRPNASLAEAVRNLRTSVLFSNLDQPPQVVMFTSTAPREGKSTTSMLMAMTSQQMGRTAVIVDCDLRMPALAGLFGTEADRPGLLAVLEGSATVEEAIFEEPDSGLHVLATRPAERRAQLNAADILASRRFAALIDTLKARYDLVILDTPPALVVTDARIVASVADAVVYAVRWDGTPRGAVVEGLRELTSVKAPIAGLVMTLVNEARAARYAYDGYGSYKGRYKDYYVS